MTRLYTNVVMYCIEVFHASSSTKKEWEYIYDQLFAVELQELQEAKCDVDQKKHVIKQYAVDDLMNKSYYILCSRIEVMKSIPLVLFQKGELEAAYKEMENSYTDGPPGHSLNAMSESMDRSRSE